jgi:hypothetical protein
MSSENARIQRLIMKRSSTAASKALLRVIERREIDIAEYDSWGKYAGEIDRGFKSKWSIREKFWRDLYAVIAKIEDERGITTHKGLIFFKIAGMSLLIGRHPKTAIRWLNRAYREDQRLWHRKHAPNPEGESGYKALIILKAFDRFCSGIMNRSVGAAVMALMKQNRKAVGKLFVSVFDRTLVQVPALPRLSTAAFDKLLSRNDYRVLVEQNYRAAEWICGKKNDLQRTNLEQYGAAQAVISLCGSSLEGVLLRNPRALKGVSARTFRSVTGVKKKRRFPSLDSLTSSYLKNCRPSPDVASALVFIWFARNLIHPEVARRLKALVVNMDFADFTVTLTANTIARLAMRSKRK